MAPDFLIVKAHRLEPLVVLPLKWAAEIATFAERTHAEHKRSIRNSETKGIPPKGGFAAGRFR